MVAKSIRELTNYTQPLPSRQIERDLRGSIYDSYVRWILWEGVRVWWRDELADWLACPRPTDASSQQVMGSATFEPCSFHWAAPAHKLTCEYVFPPSARVGVLDQLTRADYDPKATPLPELATPQY